jgi:Putative adhesin
MNTKQGSYVMALAALLIPSALIARSPAVKGSFERSLKVSGPVDLEVSTGSGDIAIRPGQAGTVRISGKIQAHNNGDDGDAEKKVRYLEQNPPIEQDGNHIRIGRLEDRELTRNVSVDYEIEVPVEAQVTSTTGSGEVSVEGIRGPVKATSGSGDLKLHSVQSDVSLKTGSGDVSLEEISGGRVEVETGSGDVELRDLRCAMRVRTGSGDISAQGELTGDWTLHAGSGEITVRLPSEAGFDLDAHTSSGEIHTGLPITVQGSTGRGELRGKVKGGGARLELSTGSGDITIS